MHLESALIERVETFIRNSVFAGSDQGMERVLDDVAALERSGRIGPATDRRLCEMILRWSHLVSCR